MGAVELPVVQPRVTKVEIVKKGNLNIKFENNTFRGFTKTVIDKPPILTKRDYET